MNIITSSGYLGDIVDLQVDALAFLRVRSTRGAVPSHFPLTLRDHTQVCKSGKGQLVATEIHICLVEGGLVLVPSMKGLILCGLRCGDLRNNCVSHREAPEMGNLNPFGSATTP